jgi:7-cyano-7-deazaguanine synthase
MKNAIVLCSGGLDSVTTAHYAKKKLKYKEIIILFFDYGQRSIRQERKFSKKCAIDCNAKFVEIKLRWLGKISKSLINEPGKVDKLRKEDLKDTKKESEKWYVPCRNLVFLTHALALAESLFIKEKEVYSIFTGFKCEGKESYPDTTEKFVKEINKLSKISCSYHFLIKAPLIKKDKEDIIKLGEKTGVDFKKTISCYSPIKGEHCGYCLACKLRQQGFYWAGIKDPTRYKQKID